MLTIDNTSTMISKEISSILNSSPDNSRFSIFNNKKVSQPSIEKGSIKDNENSFIKVKLFKSKEIDTDEVSPLFSNSLLSSALSFLQYHQEKCPLFNFLLFLTEKIELGISSERQIDFQHLIANSSKDFQEGINLASQIIEKDLIDKYNILKSKCKCIVSSINESKILKRQSENLLKNKQEKIEEMLISYATSLKKEYQTKIKHQYQCNYDLLSTGKNLLRKAFLNSMKNEYEITYQKIQQAIYKSIKTMPCNLNENLIRMKEQKDIHFLQELVGIYDIYSCYNRNNIQKAPIEIYISKKYSKKEIKRIIKNNGDLINKMIIKDIRNSSHIGVLILNFSNGCFEDYKTKFKVENYCLSLLKKHNYLIAIHKTLIDSNVLSYRLDEKYLSFSFLVNNIKYELNIHIDPSEDIQVDCTDIIIESKPITLTSFLQSNLLYHEDIELRVRTISLESRKLINGRVFPSNIFIPERFYRKNFLSSFIYCIYNTIYHFLLNPFVLPRNQIINKIKCFKKILVELNMRIKERMTECYLLLLNMVYKSNAIVEKNDENLIVITQDRKEFKDFERKQIEDYDILLHNCLKNKKKIEVIKQKKKKKNNVIKEKRHYDNYEKSLSISNIAWNNCLNWFDKKNLIKIKMSFIQKPSSNTNISVIIGATEFKGIVSHYLLINHINNSLKTQAMAIIEKELLNNDNKGKQKRHKYNTKYLIKVFKFGLYYGDDNTILFSSNFD